MKAPDYSKIPYQSIRKLFENEGITSPAELVPVCYNGVKEEYHEHLLTFHFNEPIEEVWEAYKMTHPAINWNTKMINFAALYSRIHDQFIYEDDDFPGLERGQVFLVNLKILGKLIQIPVCHEIDLVDDKNKVIKMCYLSSGKTAGSQWIEFHANGAGTQVHHRTLYKGTSFIRDRIMYPIFHTKANNQFHNKMKLFVSKG